MKTQGLARRPLPLSIRSILTRGQTSPAGTNTPSTASGASAVKVSSDIADIYVSLARPNSALQQQMAGVIRARQTAPAGPGQLTSLSDLVNRLYDLGD